MTGFTLFKRLFVIVGLPACLVVAWWITTSESDSFYWPSPAEIFGIAEQTWMEGRILSDVLPSLLRLTLGYLLALVLGATAGICIGLSRQLRGILEPVLEFFRAVPVVVLIPPLILFAGIGDAMKVAVIVIGCFFPILLNTVEGVRSIDETLTDTASCYQFRARSRLAHLVLRGASPQMVTGARQSLSLAIILMVISEMFAASNGLGFALIQFQRGFEIPQMWSAIILLGLLGVALSLLFRLIESKVLAWHQGLRKANSGKTI